MKNSFDRHVFRLLLALALTVLAVGTVIFHFVEKLSWLDAYYFCTVTLATVGYGDITPKTPAGKIIATFYIFIGVGIVTTFLSYSLRRRADKYSKRHDKDN
jgi:voltage-gated potassium channel